MDSATSRIPSKCEDKSNEVSIKERKKQAKEERRKQFEAQRAAKQDNGVEKPIKARLSKAERRALQNEQKAAKMNGKKNVSNAKISDANIINTHTQQQSATTDSIDHPVHEKTPSSSSLFVHLSDTSSLVVSKLASTDNVIHPAIIQVALQFQNGIISGSNACCVALLNALSKVIQDYETPEQRTLCRDIQQVLTIHMNFILKFRTESISMHNAFASLTHAVSHLSTSIPDLQAKSELIDHIHRFVLARITMADQLIIKTAEGKVENGDVILVFSRSQVVERIIIEAKKARKQFRVVVVDSSPYFEGKDTLHKLSVEEVKCSYVMLNSISYIINEVTKVFLGAAAMLSNGAMFSRCGSALIAAMATTYRVPLIVCCETYKFSDRVHLDAISINELCNPDDIVHRCHIHPIPLGEGWSSNPCLEVLNLAFDLTPAEFVSMVITEIGCIPATSVPAALRELYNKSM